MRILASLALAILTSVSVPVLAMDYQPVATASVSARDSRAHLVNTISSTNGASAATPLKARRYNVHRRALHQATPVSATGLIITDFKPDDHHLYAGQDYLPPKTDDLVFAETNVAPIKLHKVGPTSLVASVKYRF